MGVMHNISVYCIKYPQGELEVSVNIFQENF